MNKRTDCQLLTICHRWQTFGQTELISLLFTLFTVFPFFPANNHPTQQHYVQMELQQILLC